ncbi:hypothetical protein QVD17_14488 [Tagetes erecta]|uniref:Uncharacterized protein n=1 Tax=Tagetes erecta TaxID=13708 RepID=A0AAD8KXY0_TARER|nr:hypothetical protein QVD17_14488 [Tagetes erecta]
MTPRKNRINENSPDASPWPVRNFARRALGVGTQPARKTEYGSTSLEYFMTPRKNWINENSPGASPRPVHNFARRALGVVLETSLEYFMTPRKNRINENSPGAFSWPTSLEYFITPRKNWINENSPGAFSWPVRNFARSALGVGTQPAKKLSMGLFTESDHNFGPGDFPRIFYDSTKESDQ